MNNKGFTLIELLVVVLIIGILSSVALPNYTKAIEKSRLSEALVNSKAIVDGAQRYVQMDPSKEGTNFTKDNIADVELKGGSWNGDKNKYTTKLFTYELGNTTGTVVTVSRKNGTETLYTFTVDDNNKKTVTAGSGAVKTNVEAFLNSL